MDKSLHFNTQLVHAGANPDNEYGALSTPLYQTSTFAFDNCEQGGRRFAGEEQGYIYTRLANPTVTQLEQRMAALEKMEAAAATSTGMAAVSGVLMAMLSQGDHLIASNAVYGCTFALLSEQFPRYGIEVTFVDMANHDEIEAAKRDNTKAIFLETPVNPNLAVYDLTFIGNFAKQHAILSIVDNTFLTPYLQQPQEFGIDIVLHSATKYLNGHGDVVAGIICGSEEHITQIKHTTLKDIGGTMSPFDAWLILRGLKTLAVRMERHCDNAEQVAQWLEAHEGVKTVYYPGLVSHAGHRFIGSQMRGAGGVIAFELNGDLDTAKSFADSLKLFKVAVSLGDAESLIQHPASMTHSTYSPEARNDAGISDNLLRISVGLEQVEDLINDLDQAMIRTMD
ncbi:methionine gamma-lyase [Psychrobium sp. MM17-31]|uniref:methionine gamma-lyase n=1 Tax=Psychrobium sp. MM17-31 TaxID=2917758 RepID=UPI001EF71DF1|nr:methionine gamma-lyase [Psychrobium sp. MM17-31]MCG7531970.1 methionine gamma-lyase [Psychrobium sp. MM17-31]